MAASAFGEACRSCLCLPRSDHVEASDSFERQRCGHMLPGLRLHRPQVLAHARLRERCETLCQFDSAFQCVTRGDQPVDQSNRGRFLGVDLSAGQDQIGGPRLADQTGQTNRPTIDEWYTEAPAEDPELRVECSHSQVAPGSQLNSASDRIPLDSGDDGFRQ